MNPSTKPLYEQIKEYLLVNIQSGVFPPGTRIPSERALADQFGVSRLTVSKAIKDLIQTGRLHVRIGKGTFISADTIDQQLEALTSFTEEMQRRGQKASSRVLHLALDRASEALANILDLPPGAEVVILKRVRLADEAPIALETSTLVAAHCPGITGKYDFAYESLYEVLRRDYGVRLTHAEQTIEARSAEGEIAQVLHLPVGSPILYMTRVTYTEWNRPVEYVLSAYSGERYKFRAVLRTISKSEEKS